MATAIVTPKFDFVTQGLPLLELGLNTALMLAGVPGGAALASTLEASLNPIIASIKAGSNTPTQSILAGYGATIGVLNALRQQTTLPADKLDKVETYIEAAQDATTAYLTAQQGYDGTTPQHVDPIV